MAYRRYCGNVFRVWDVEGVTFKEEGYYGVYISSEDSTVHF